MQRRENADKTPYFSVPMRKMLEKTGPPWYIYPPANTAGPTGPDKSFPRSCVFNMDSQFSFLEKIGQEPNNLIKGLQLIQAAEGYVSDDAIKAASAYFGVPAAEIEGVLSFYAQFKRVKPGKFKIAVCDGTACHIKGAPQVHEWLRQEIGLIPGQTSKDGLFSLETVACLGCCSLAPVMSVNGKVHAKLDRKGLKKILKEYTEK